MLLLDLVLDPGTVLTVATSAPQTFSLLGGNSPSGSVRSVSSANITNPRTLRIAHSQRHLKGFKVPNNAGHAASDVIFDRHLCRLDYNVPNTSRLDPTSQINASVQLVIEVPRLGALETPNLAFVAGMLRSLTFGLLASNEANLLKILNNET